MFNHVEKETVFVQYIGKKSVKYDTVFGTSTVWIPGAVRRLQVPKGHKIRMLQHQDVWVEVDAEGAQTAQAQEQEKLPSERQALLAEAKSLGLKLPVTLKTDEIKARIDAQRHSHS
jgi:hypothetical protein